MNIEVVDNLGKAEFFCVGKTIYVNRQYVGDFLKKHPEYKIKAATA